MGLGHSPEAIVEGLGRQPAAWLARKEAWLAMGNGVPALAPSDPRPLGEGTDFQSTDLGPEELRTFSPPPLSLSLPPQEWMPWVWRQGAPPSLPTDSGFFLTL